MSFETFTRDRHGLRTDVEDFLYYEAALLDEWRLDEWVGLFLADARYVVPATDLPKGEGSDSLVLIDDDLDHIRGRVTRLQSRRAYRESPRSRTRRLVTNIRVVSGTPDEIEVAANFLIVRIRGDVQQFVGRYSYRLVPNEGSFAIRLRRAELDLEDLRAHGALTIIL